MSCFSTKIAFTSRALRSLVVGLVPKMQFLSFGVADINCDSRTDRQQPLYNTTTESFDVVSFVMLRLRAAVVAPASD